MGFSLRFHAPSRVWATFGDTKGFGLTSEWFQSTPQGETKEVNEWEQRKERKRSLEDAGQINKYRLSRSCSASRRESPSRETGPGGI